MLPLLAGLFCMVALIALSGPVFSELLPSLKLYFGPLSRPLRVVVGLSFFLPILAVPFGIAYIIIRRFGGSKAFQFLGAVMLVEGLTGRGALRRSAELYDKAGNALQPFQVAIAVVAGGFGAVIGAGAGLIERSMGPGIGLGWVAPFMAILLVVAASFLSLVGALTYLRARRAAGEPLDPRAARSGLRETVEGSFLEREGGFEPRLRASLPVPSRSWA